MKTNSSITKCPKRMAGHLGITGAFSLLLLALPLTATVKEGPIHLYNHKRCHHPNGIHGCWRLREHPRHDQQ